jgi:signal transduction histidine kinase
LEVKDRSYSTWRLHQETTFTWSMSALYSRKPLPFVAFIVFGTIALVLWDNHNRHERELILRHTEASAEQMRMRIVGLMNARMASLELLADRWVERRPPDFSQKRFLQFAENFYTHYPGFTGINWVDPEGIVRWVFPEKTNAVAKGQRVYENPDSRYRATFEKGEQGIEYLVTPCAELCQGGIGFDTFWPLRYNGQLQGHLNGVFQVARIMETCLTQDIFNHFWINLFEEDCLIYHQGDQAKIDLRENDLHVVREVDFRGKIWQLHLQPNPAIYAAPGSLHLPFLAIGLALSAALSFLLHFSARMERYKAARDQAIHEVGERKRAEETLRENEKKLEALLAELAAKNVELESFVYTVSHDLKTPIVTIDGFVGALREDLGKGLSEQSEKYLKYMSDAARKMELLINDLLDLSRIGRLSEMKREFPFAELVRDAIETLEVQIKARGIVVNVQEDLPVIYGERKRLGQVADNLLANAVKYIGKDNPSPRIDVGAEELAGQNVFFIRDNGIGIEKRYFDKLFEIFQRLPSAKRIEGEGTGIGMTIVKRIIEHHGGRIWLTSEPGKGTTFFFTVKEKEASR